VRAILQKLTKREDLTPAEMARTFERLMSGQLQESEIAAFLMGLQCKGVSSEELAAAAKVMRAHVTPVPIAVDAIDTCGTGGDAVSTFNVSTCAAIIAAGAGAYVAKHGNRTNTRKSGSAEVLDRLGVNLDADVPTVSKCIEQAHIGFLFAIKLHPAMKYAAPVRKRLGLRTIFNLLGPLTNPAGVTRQVVGVSRDDETDKIAWALRFLDAKRAMVVHGLHEGLCDLSICGPSKISELSEGVITTYVIEPEELGLQTGRMEQLLIHSPEESATVIRSILDGARGPQRDMAVLNAAVALVVADMAKDLKAGVEIACQSIDSGKAKQRLAQWVELSQA